jgi:hypothetical protein
VTSEDARRAHAAGYEVHVRKPVRPDDLVTTIARLCEARAGQPHS